MEERVTSRPVASRLATFKDGQAAAVHRWFRLTPSFGPSLVRHMLQEMDYSDGQVVVDPFAGAGTTQVECQLLGIPSFGTEINPFLHFVGSTSLEWSLDPSRLRSLLDGICICAQELSATQTLESLAELGTEVPPIHNPYRWWRPDVLLETLAIRHSISGVGDEREQAFFTLALAGVLVPDLSNVTLGRLQLHFIIRDDDSIDALGLFRAHASTMIHDLEELAQRNSNALGQIAFGDATDTASFPEALRADLLVTSPPYPNRYSYVWNTRPHLYMFGFMSGSREAAELDKATIGGTWGSATSVLQKGVYEFKHQVAEEVTRQVVAEIRPLDDLMANYVSKYFDMMASHLLAVDAVMNETASLAYVVGCSRTKGVFVETDVLLGKLIERLGLGYSVGRIERIRKRNSGKDLHESVVYATRR